MKKMTPERDSLNIHPILNGIAPQRDIFNGILAVMPGRVHGAASSIASEPAPIYVVFFR